MASAARRGRNVVAQTIAARSHWDMLVIRLVLANREPPRGTRKNTTHSALRSARRWRRYQFDWSRTIWNRAGLAERGKVSDERLELFIAKVLGNIRVVRWRWSTILLLAGEKPIHPNDANMNRIAVALKTLPTPR